MNCKRCESYLNKHNKSRLDGYCKHCFFAMEIDAYIISTKIGGE